MSSTERTTGCRGIFALILLSWVTLAYAWPDPSMFEPRQLKQSLCASENTASGSANISIWQTNGLCSDFCKNKNYAFAIVQYQSCWCSDVAPSSSSEADISDKCNDICPGYDVEKCGSRPNYYGYIALGKTPTSTAGGGKGDTTTKAPSTTQNTATPDPETTTSSTKSTTSKPKTTVQTVTADGTVRTVTVTPTATGSGSDGATGASELTPGASQSSGGGPSAGTVAGIVVGVIVIVVALIGAVLFLFWRRQKRKKDQSNYESSHRGSSAGMTSSPQNPEMVVTVDSGRWDANETSQNRLSRLGPLHDPRLDHSVPRPMYGRSKSVESVNTLRDDRDYSRKMCPPVLSVRNPDPE